MARVRNIALVAVSVLAAVAGGLAWVANQQWMAAEDQRQQADAILGRATNIVQPQTDIKTKKGLFALFEAGANHGHVASMTNLGGLYDYGFGVEQDYAKAREWYEKAAAKDDAGAMTKLGALYENGHGVAQDYGKAREWYEKAAAKDDTGAMNNLGLLYGNGTAWRRTTRRRANGSRRPLPRTTRWP